LPPSIYACKINMTIDLSARRLEWRFECVVDGSWG
jgi:hypothetical protein